MSTAKQATRALQNLAGKRIINVSGSIRKTGLDERRIHQRMYDRHRKIAPEQIDIIFQQIISDIHEAIDTLELDLEMVIMSILSNLDSGQKEIDVIEIISRDGLIPYGYLHRENQVTTIYGSNDRFYPRNFQHTGRRLFLSNRDLEKILSQPDCELTKRGTSFIDDIEAKQARDRAAKKLLEHDQKSDV